MANMKSERRKKRIPFGSARSKLQVEAPEGYVLRWINDTPGRINQALDAGYEFHYDDNVAIGDAEEDNQGLGTRISYNVGKTDDGHPLKAYLMKIRKDWYEEDQSEKQKAIDEVDRAIRNGQFELGGEPQNVYVPEAGINIKN